MNVLIGYILSVVLPAASQPVFSTQRQDPAWAAGYFEIGMNPGTAETVAPNGMVRWIRLVVR